MYKRQVKELQSVGIRPDVVLCRTEEHIPDDQKDKIALFCNIPKKSVIEAIDADSIYDVPLVYHKNGLDEVIWDHFGIKPKEPNLKIWLDIKSAIKNPEGEINIAVVGKYTSLIDSYKSLDEALTHGGIANKTKVKVHWIDSSELEDENKLKTKLQNIHVI